MRDLLDLTGSVPDTREIIIDSFAGAGGASMGIRMATGRDPDVAVNHDPVAVAIHAANHPGTLHFCKSVWEVTPQELGRGRPVGLLHASPDCKHFSKAKGGKPLSQHIRDLAWVIVRYAECLFPRVIVMENVEEFRQWCDLIPKLDKDGNPVLGKDGKVEMIPDKSKIDKDGYGNIFKDWLSRLKRLRYRVEWREVKACDYGAPTIRKRLFIVARRDGRPIVWPEPTHGAPKSAAVRSGDLLPWRTAAECIDWNDPAPSIFERKRPLAENTLRRVAKGIERYVVEAERPFLVNLTHGGRLEGVGDPLRTVTGAHRGEKSLCCPLLTEHANGPGRNFGADEPLRTQCAQVKGGHFALLAPFLEAHYGSKGGSDVRVHPVSEGLRTASTENRFGLACPILIGPGGREGQCPPMVPDRPMRTVTAKGDKALLCPTLVGAGGPTYSGKPASADAPVGTLLAENHRAVCTAMLTQYNGCSESHPVDEPANAVTSRDRLGFCPVCLVPRYGGGLCTAHIVKNYTGVVGSDADAPLGTVTAVDHNALCAASMVKMRGNAANLAPGSMPSCPLGTISAGGTHHGITCAHLLKFYKSSIGQDLHKPAHAMMTKPKMGLVESRTGGGHAAEVRALLLRFRREERCRRERKRPVLDWWDELLGDALAGEVCIDGQIYIIDDIGLRMLRPRELARAQGFPDDYVLDPIKSDGKRVTLTEQVRGIGNSVCPPLEAALVRANLPEWVPATGKAEVAA